MSQMDNPYADGKSDGDRLGVRVDQAGLRGARLMESSSLDAAL